MSDESNPLTGPLSGRRIVLGVTGGIAAYKAVELCRRLVDSGAFVSPVMTEGAQKFIGKTTLSALASEPVRTKLFDDEDPIPHTRLGQGADIVVVAPATARLLADYVAGRSHDLLTGTLLATRAPVVVAPAMHTEMWEHPAVVDNIATLRGRGVHIVEPEVGRLAGGDVGAGRLAAPEAIYEAVKAVLDGTAGPKSQDLAGLKILISAGGTREKIDAVRVITNRSSGKQGYALAAEAAARGAEVVLVSTVQRPAPVGVAQIIEVSSAAEMEAVIMPLAPACDVIVMAAAVADFRPVAPSERKLKKHDGPPRIELEATNDFLVDLGASKPTGQLLVGFAAETDDVLENAMAKMAAKKLDFIVANDVAAPGVGFEHDTNQVSILVSDGSSIHIPFSDKRVIAGAIFDAVAGGLADRRSLASEAEHQNQT